MSECFEVVLLVSMWTWYNGPCNERPPSWRITTGLRPYFHYGRFIFPCECLPCTTLKRELKWRSIDLQVSLRTSKMCKYYHLQAWLGCAISLFVQKKYFFPLAMSFSRHRHISSVFTSKSQKGWLWHIWYFCNTFWPCSWCHGSRLMGTKGATQGHVSEDLQMSVFNKQDQKLRGKTACW